MENFSKIQKFAEECKAVKEEVERASTKPAILAELAKNWANMKWIISKLLHKSLFYSKAKCEAINIQFFFFFLGGGYSLTFFFT